MQYYVTAPSVLLRDYLLASNLFSSLYCCLSRTLSVRQDSSGLKSPMRSFKKLVKEKRSRNTASHGVFALLQTCMVSKEAALCLLL